MRIAFVCLCLILTPTLAHAFCGFYVGSADEALVNNATNVVLMREGDVTVLSMQNDYQGPPKKFALVVPVPVVLKKADVKTLPREVFDRVDRLAAPRLVEYWEQDPCRQMGLGLGGLGTRGMGSGSGGLGLGGASTRRPAVRIEAQFEVGEYEIVILSADDSAALDTWLRENRYNIPPGAEAALRPYVASGMKFFVAKVNPRKVKFEAGRAVLSPLRVAYQSKDFRLPVRLGLLNSSGTQDLLVHILARDKRYEVANYPNVTIPTNLDVTDDVRTRFAEFYAALFDKTLEKNPGAVVTEYAWQATKCDPCPGPVLSAKDLATLGADVAMTGGVATQATGVQLRVLPPSVKGGLPKQVVRRILRRRQNAFRHCIEKVLAKAPQALNGPLRAEFLVGPTGKVTAVRKVVGDGVTAESRTCIEGHLKRVRFPKPTSAGLVKVKAKWNMRPATWGRRSNPLMRFVLTRLHYRYDKTELGEDLVFTPAHGIVGGREVRAPAKPRPQPKAAPVAVNATPSAGDTTAPDKLTQAINGPPMPGLSNSFGGIGLVNSPEPGVLETGATESSLNNFQGRYAIRHVWTGDVACSTPRYGVWGANPRGDAKPASASGMAPVKRGALKLVTWVPAGIPELGLAAEKSIRPTD